MGLAQQGLITLVRRFGKEYGALKKKRRVLDFGDLEHKTLDLLLGLRRDGPTAAAREIGKRYREVLVDEYQDSNAVQDAIFGSITREKQNCFLVGDVKQSIYQFRLADPGIFLDKYNRYGPAAQAQPGQGRRVLLSDNFRSGGEVVEAVNQVFSCCMSQDVGGLRYGEAEALREGIPHEPLPNAGVEFYTLEAQEDANREEAAFVAGRIGEMLNRGTLVRTKEGLRPVTPEDIVILLRSPGSLGAAFRQALEYLAATGHRRLGLVNGPETLPYFRNLHSAFRESCARFGLTVDEELFYEADPYGDFALDAVLAGRRLFDRPDRPDAVMVSSGILVKSIVVQALQRGVRIPADASIVAFGTNDWEAYKFVPRLTAVERNYAGIIEAGVAMLCELMDKGAVQVPQVTVPERFSIRDSTANRLA